MSITSPQLNSAPRPKGLARFVAAAARGAARRPKATIGLWLVLVIGCVAAGSFSGTRTLSNAGSGTGESSHAEASLHRAGLVDPATENVTIASSSKAHTIAAANALATRARRLAAVSGVQSPGDPGTGSAGLSKSGGRTALVVVTLRGDPDDADEHVAPLERLVSSVSASHPDVTVREAGGGSIGHAINQTVDNGLHRVELISLPITLIILVLAFGALVAASVPLLLGLTSVAAALGAGGLVSHLAPAGDPTAPVVVLIGLAVGIDYSLFYIRRERAERRAGAGPDAALQAAASTVGRAIVIAGATVVIGLAGLLFTGFGEFTSMALGASLVVAIAVLGSVTVLPAVLALLGDRVDRGRLFGKRAAVGRRAHATGRPTAWGRLGRTVTGHPRTSLAIALVLLVGLAVPVLSMRTADPGEHDLSASTPVLVAEHAIERAFPGSSDTAELVVSGRQLDSPAARHSLAELGLRGRQITGSADTASVRVATNGRTALVAIPMRDQRLEAAERTVRALRHDLNPATARLIPGASAQLGGDAAGDVDFTARLSAVTPLVIAFVLTLAFALLIVTFRSALLAVSVMALNLLSVGASFGVLVAVFQHRWAESLLGFTSDGAVVNWLPLFAFVVLFGLSMDYTVLILERAREARQAGAGAREAAAEALGSTGGTVTSAALVMVAVFAVFATLPLLEFKQLGVGLAAAIALDATIVRGLALPAVLALLGDRGLAPARGRRVRSRQWDHGASVRALDTAND